MIKIIIHDTPPSRNYFDRQHWGVQSKIKKQWIHDIYYALYNQRPDKPYNKAKVKITIYFATNRRRDDENYMLKFIADGLVRAGIITDDRSEVIGTSKIELKIDKENPRTEIEVEEI